MKYDIDKIRSYFPILNQTIYGKPFIYFDSAASSHKPVQVIETEKKLFEEFYGNIHRGAHFMADKATIEFENVRTQVATLINAKHREEIIFTKGTTESINLVAFSFCERFLNEGDEIIVSEMEHHANIVPWQLAASRKKAKIVKLPFDDSGILQIGKLGELISSKTKLVAVAHVSNVLGTINPVTEITAIAHNHNIPVLLDGAQAVQHLKIDVQETDVDFYMFSAHKIYGPNGVGILYGKKKWLDQLPPYQGGGEMIAEVSFDGTTFNELPYKFEAGTPNITGVIAFGASLNLIDMIGIENIAAWEHDLLVYATSKLKQIPGIRIYGEAPEKSGVISFNIEGIHHYDLGMLLDKMGIAVRTGHLCADTVMKHFDIQGCVRISFGIYNTQDEIDAFIDATNRIRKMF